jgi:hypothetical protein
VLAQNLEPVFAERYCNLEGFDRPSRQTIVVLDQRLVVANPEKGLAPENQRWAREVLGLFDPDAPGRVATFLPRERVSLYVAPPSGGQPRLILTGCVPRFSDKELQQINSQLSAVQRAMDYAWGSGAAEKAASYGKDFFRTKLANQLWRIGPPQDNRSADPLSLFRSLARDRQLINLQNGIPRMIFITDLSKMAQELGPDVASARSWGFRKAKEIGLRLQRAEVYLIGPSSDRLRDAMDTFFLGSEGDLVAWSEEMVGIFAANPVSVQVFSGKVSYCENEFPMDLRLSVDSEGQLLNSWLAVTVQDRTSTPLKGTFRCEGSDNCFLKSQECGLGQLWARLGCRPGENPEFTASLPMSGFRSLEGRVEGSQLTGQIFDALGKLDCKDKQVTSYRFRLTKVDGVAF